MSIQLGDTTIKNANNIEFQLNKNGKMFITVLQENPIHIDFNINEDIVVEINNIIIFNLFKILDFWNVDNKLILYGGENL